MLHTPADWACVGEEQDLQEMQGHLLDNACRSARSAVNDNGPGIAPEQRATVPQRGVRLDESIPGSGLGLIIVTELAELYGGGLTLDHSPLGGVRAVLRLPILRPPTVG